MIEEVVAPIIDPDIQIKSLTNLDDIKEQTDKEND